MASRAGKRGHGRREHRREAQLPLGETDAIEVNESSPVIIAFRGFQTQLDAKYDKHERLVKKSRDVTIQSKRIIFLLHRYVGSSNKEAVLKEAEQKLEEVEQSFIKQIALELQGEDVYLYLRAISPGLQEYVEALSFYHYLTTKSLITLPEVQSRLEFDLGSPCPEAEQTDADTTAAASASAGTPPVARVPLPTSEFMLGIADLTGELMRLAISSLGVGDAARPFELCGFMRAILDGFLTVGGAAASREVARKVATLRQSVHKVEAACYALRVRGSEMPSHRLADVFREAEPAAPDTEVM
ncbi:PREDICTED: translin-associated protein X-like [Priapulus caudatus]|uniref:Translin-associated protein X-like n=1 Tax=Priapulus caudatus TaxID=37621 RepID=A0ABM1F5J2_PRICU|nr:PREDICTED: translin-associated protein X-like [Priapulus caudatus]